MAAAALLCSSAQAEVQHRLPSLSSVFPQGSEPGKTVRVEVLGEQLDRASAVLFEDASIAGKLLGVSPTRLEMEFRVSAAAAFGPHYFRVVSPRGASNVALFRVGDQPHLAEQEPNSTLETAQAVSPPVTINGRLNGDADFDFFRFRAQAGDTWIFDLRAARNGSGLDAALILLDARGRKLEHDEDTFIWDPFFAHKFKDAGEYFVVVQPSSGRNDPGYAYQLDIRKAAYVETVSPLSLRPGTETEVTLYGRGLLSAGAKLRFLEAGFEGAIVNARGDSATARVRIPASAKPGPREFRVEANGLSNPATLLVDATPLYAGEPLLPIPVSITGTAKYRQPERFQFQAAAGETLVFEVKAQRFGSPVDSNLRILDAKGKVIASNDDFNFAGVQFSKDSRILQKFKDGGEYVLEMRNLWTVTGENFPYQLTVRRPEPSLDLMLGTDQPYLYPGVLKKWKVTAVRTDGFEGEIPLIVQGLPSGVEAKPASIPSGKSEGEIELLASDVRPGSYARVSVSADKAQGPAWRSARISSGGGEGATSARIEGAVLAVVEKPLFSLECASTNLNLAPGQTTELKVMVSREKGFEEKLAFRAENLPAGVTLETMDQGMDLATLRLRADAGIPPGRAARVAILAAGGGQTQEAPRISVLVD